MALGNDNDWHMTVREKKQHLAMTPEQRQVFIDQINTMSREDMARLWRFAASGHPFFRTDLPYHEVFEKRFFGELGGFSPEISKQIGLVPI